MDKWTLQFTPKPVLLFKKTVWLYTSTLFKQEVPRNPLNPIIKL